LFFIEHWLGEEEAYFFNELSEKHQILFEADYSVAARLRCDGSISVAAGYISSSGVMLAYVDCLEVLLEAKVTEYKQLEGSVLEKLDFLHGGINGALLKAARRAERMCGIVTCNGVRRGRCKYSSNTPEIS